MTYKYEWRTRDNIRAVVKDLQETVEKFMKIESTMQKESMEDAIFPWSKATFDSIESVVNLPDLCEGMLKIQVRAKNAGKPNPFEGSKEKSAKDTERKKNKKEVVENARNVSHKHAK